jgi:TPP-dependent indolepyruvate ferredoxin oxidoreductase alpha subunit
VGGGGTPPTKGERKVLRIFRIFPFDDEQSLEGCAYLTKVVVLEDIKPCGIEKNIYISLVNIQTARKIFGKREEPGNEVGYSAESAMFVVKFRFLTSSVF